MSLAATNLAQNSEGLGLSFDQPHAVPPDARERPKPIPTAPAPPRGLAHRACRSFGNRLATLGTLSRVAGAAEAGPTSVA